MLDFNKKFKNSDKFRPAALAFIENKQKTGFGTYCTFSPNSKEYDNFWNTEQERCIHGYRADDGDWISGFNYFYLNYCPILRQKRTVSKDNTGKDFFSVSGTEDFPLFYSYDSIYFHYIEECIVQGKHAVVLKARRKGYSYKNASMLVRNYFFKPNSKGFVFATDKKYLTGDGVLNKARRFVSWVDTHTPFAKKRQVKDSEMHWRASIIQTDPYGNRVEAGYMSEIMGFSLKSNPDKLRGIVANLIFFEEGGSFSELEDAFNIARPSVEQDSFVTGLICVYGTASLDNESMTAISRMFTNPDAYNILSVPNIWDDHSSSQQCGFFHPYYENLEGIDKKTGKRLYMDDDGNTLKVKTIEYILKEREKVVERAVSDRNIDAYVIERPIRPSEALTTYGSSIFPKKLLQEQLLKLKTDPDYEALKQVGHLSMTGTKPSFVRHPSDDSIQSYRLKSSDKKEGALVVWEHPSPEPPQGLYLIGVDSYDFDASQTDSLGSCIVFKRFQDFESFHDMIVAEYTGRPQMAEDFYESVRRIGLYFNAKIMYENNNKGIYTYFVNHHCEYMLDAQPDIIDKIVEKTTVSRGRGVHVTKDIRNAMNGWIREWLLDEFADGRKNVERVFSIPLLEELLEWNDKANFDRVAALGCVMVARQQQWLNVIKDSQKEKIKTIMEVPIFSKAYYDEAPKKMPDGFRIFA